MTGKIVVVGSMNADLRVTVQSFAKPGETILGAIDPPGGGGKGANQAAVAACLGSAVEMAAAVGTDHNGDLLLAGLTAFGVGVTQVRRRLDAPTGLAVVTVDSSGENCIVVQPGANATLEFEDLPAAALREADVVCLSLEIPASTAFAAAQTARAAGALCVLNASPAGRAAPELLSAADIVIVNAHEAAELLGAVELPDQWETVAAALRSRGMGRVVITRGGDGVVVLDDTVAEGEQSIAYVSAQPVAVVDTTGCGDAFAGALAHHLAAGERLTRAAIAANAIAARVATSAGAQTSYAALLLRPQPS